MNKVIDLSKIPIILKHMFGTVNIDRIKKHEKKSKIKKESKLPKFSNIINEIL